METLRKPQRAALIMGSGFSSVPGYPNKYMRQLEEAQSAHEKGGGGGRGRGEGLTERESEIKMRKERATGGGGGGLNVQRFV